MEGGKVLRAVVVFGVLWAACTSVQATIITVPNFSFESPVNADGAYTSVKGATSTTVAANWTTVAPANIVGAGTINPGSGWFTGAEAPNDIPQTGGGLPLGLQGAFSWWGAGSWTSGSNTYFTSTNSLGQVQAGQDYTLTVAVGTPLNVGGNLNPKVNRAGVAIRIIKAGVGTIDYWNDSNAGGTAIPAAGNWTDFPLTVPSATLQAANLIGGDVYVRLWGRVSSTTGKQAILFDNVRLTETPEPASLALLGLGGLGLLLRRRR